MPEPSATRRPPDRTGGDPELIRSLLGRREPGRESLIPILQDLQEAMGYVSQDAVREAAAWCGVSENEVYGVATFYSQFRFRPPCDHTVRVCQGTACHVRGADRVLAEMEQHLGVPAGGQTEDGRFDLQRVACVGCCALAPTVIVDGEVHAEVTPRGVRSLLARYGHRED